ncbi:polysaccharide biosynthesis/export family protein [Novacetimonas hansenii]|uniref:polysaccharide biosynthesis/export family protein n=1 Tax=Novacetimonas hansenii TaxID=436 RepID=UPI0009D77DF8|nr:polysaccharide biosynthesis/export family protein [Novacetimonas hansenii]PYD73747.1 sugar transporter [Novacetimonas hansenii]
MAIQPSNFMRKFFLECKKAFAIGILPVALLAGCDTLPDSAPTESGVKSAQSSRKKNTIGYGIVQISPDLITLLNSETPPLFSNIAQAPAQEHYNSDRAGAGDTLEIDVYEMGESLFTTRTSSNTASGIARRSNFPSILVNGDGTIDMPYVGHLMVDKLTSDEIADKIRAGLKGKSEAPQVLVRISKNLANSVIVYGDVKLNGRMPLTLHQEHLVDAVALAGGSLHDPEDTIVELTRHNQIATGPLKLIEDNPEQNILLEAGDRIHLIYEPRTYTVFGAAGKPVETSFSRSSVNLAEALARVGGPADSRADPNAVFIIRYESSTIAERLGLPVDSTKPTTPIVYQLDMMNPASFFLAEHFIMKNKDTILIANAKTNKVQKVFNLINTLIAPGMSAGRNF